MEFPLTFEVDSPKIESPGGHAMFQPEVRYYQGFHFQPMVNRKDRLSVD